MNAWRLPFPAILALRYLKSTRKDAFVSFLSLVAGLGLALGVAALILALASLAGFQQVLIEQTLSHTPQIEIRLPAAATADDVDDVRRRVEAVPGVEGVQALVRGPGWLRVGGRGVQPVELVGFDGNLPPSLTGGAPRKAAPGLWLSEDVAGQWGLERGDRVELASPRPTLTPFGGPQPRVRTVTFEGVFPASGDPQDTDAAALPRVIAESLLAPVPVRLEVDVGGFDRAVAVAADVEAVVPAGSEVSTWQQLEGALFFVLKLEKALVFVGVSLIVLVASLALVASLSLLIANKRHELGALGTLGATPRALSRAFLLLGGAVGLTGAVLGVTLGGIAALLLDRFHAVPLPEGVYFLDHVPFQVEVGDLATILGLTLLLSLGASLYAARRVSTITPVEVLRR